MARTDSAGTPAFPWGAAIALATPAFALAVAGGLAGISSLIGVILIAASAIYLVVELFVVQPKIEQRMLVPTGGAATAQAFLERALAFSDVDEVASEFGRAVTGALGDVATFLLVPAADGEVRVIAGSGAVARTDLGDPTPAFVWLEGCEEPFTRADLAAVEDEGGVATLALLDTLGCEVVLPLRHRGLLLGLGLIGASRGDHSRFFRAMRAYTTVAVANTFLGAGAREHSGLTKTFDLATAMQESLMPDERPNYRDGFELRGLFRPVAECGGDLWVWRDLADGKVLLLIADATGHGAAPALLAAVAKGAIDAFWQMSLKNLDPGRLLAALNLAVHRTGRQRYMMTAFAAVVDTRAAKLHFANAGQNFPYFIHGVPRPDGRRVEPLIARGNSLGASAVAAFETQTRHMDNGDKLLLYTDGLTDAGSPTIEPWGEKRFRSTLEAMAGERATRIPELLMAEIEQYLAGRELADDITMVSFQYGNHEAES